MVAALRAASPTGQGEGYVADFTSLARAATLARELILDHPDLTVLVNNAGILLERYQQTPDGFEAMLQVNYLAPFLLTTELLPMLRANRPARVVHLGSSAHTWGRIGDDLTKGYGGFRGYARSKLGLVSFAAALARRVPAADVTSNAIHPGVIATALPRTPGPISWLMRTASPLLKRPATGGLLVAHLATSPDLAGRTGLYFNGARETRPARMARDERAAEALWLRSEDAVARFRR